MQGTNGFRKQGTDRIATAENGTCKDCEELGLEDLRGKADTSWKQLRQATNMDQFFRNGEVIWHTVA
jgi:hypothetical protein